MTSKLLPASFTNSRREERRETSVFVPQLPTNRIFISNRFLRLTLVYSSGILQPFLTKAHGGFYVRSEAEDSAWTVYKWAQTGPKSALEMLASPVYELAGSRS